MIEKRTLKNDDKKLQKLWRTTKSKKDEMMTNNRSLKFKKRIMFTLILFIAIVLSSCEQKNAHKVNMYNTSDDMVGTVQLSEEPDGVQAKVNVEEVSPGFHGIHIHEYADCSGSDFKEAGNHFNPTGEEHGLMNAEGAHLGDLPNIEADSDGELKGEVTVDDATLLGGKKSLLKGEGTSIVITEGMDDGMTQPGGDSGKRIMCGVISEDRDDENKKEPSDPTKTE